MIQRISLIFLLFFIVHPRLFAEPINDLSEEEEIKQAIDAYKERSWDLGIAAGYGVKTNPLINSDDIPMYVVLNIAWFGDYLFFDNGDVGVTVFESDKLSFSVIAHINNERVVFEWLNNSKLGVQFFPSNSFASTASDFSSPAANETSISEGQEEFFVPPDAKQRDFLEENLADESSIEIPKRSLAVDGGIEIIYVDDWGDVQLQVLTDITNTHQGVEIWASYAYPWRYGNWKMTPSLGINWKSSHLLDYYYGVRESEANFNRPAYKAQSGLNSFARLTVSYRITDNWGITGIAEYQTLSRSIRNSPIVNQDSIQTLFIGLMYNF